MMIRQRSNAVASRIFLRTGAYVFLSLDRRVSWVSWNKLYEPQSGGIFEMPKSRFSGHLVARPPSSFGSWSGACTWA